jgi:hypothetical protein
LSVSNSPRNASENGVSHKGLKLYINDEVVAETEIRTMTGLYALTGEGLCVGYDGGDAVSSEYTPKFAWSGGEILKVAYDVADDAYIDVKQHLAMAIARD